MENLDHSKICAILSKIESAMIITTKDSPYLHSCEIDEDYQDKNYHSDDIILSFNWFDEEGEYAVKFTAESLSNAVLGVKYSEGAIFLFDSDGQKEQISIFNLKPINFCK